MWRRLSCLRTERDEGVASTFQNAGNENEIDPQITKTDGRRFSAHLRPSAENFLAKQRSRRGALAAFSAHGTRRGRRVYFWRDGGLPSAVAEAGDPPARKKESRLFLIGHTSRLARCLQNALPHPSVRIDEFARRDHVDRQMHEPVIMQSNDHADFAGHCRVHGIISEE